MQALELDQALAIEPPPPLRSNSRITSRKEQILEGLEPLILLEGFRSTRLADLAASLNASYATLYQIAPTKEALVLLVVDRWYQRGIKAGREMMLNTPEPVERLNGWVAFGVTGTAKTSTAFWVDVSEHPPLGQLVDTYSRYYIEVLKAILDEGVRKGKFRSVNTSLVAWQWEISNQALRNRQMLHRFDKQPIAEHAAQWVDIILNGISAR